MEVETAEIFSKHIKKSKFENLDDKTIQKIKIFLLDTIGVGIAGSTGAKLSELKKIDISDIGKKTTANFLKVFNL